MSLKNKRETYTVEGINSVLRHYMLPLHRKNPSSFLDQ